MMPSARSWEASARRCFGGVSFWGMALLILGLPAMRLAAHPGEEPVLQSADGSELRPGVRLSDAERSAWWAEHEADPWGIDRDVFRFLRPVAGGGEAIESARERPFPLLPGESAIRSRSIGTVTTGHVVQARALEAPTDVLAILPRQKLRGLRYGTDELIRMIEDAARDVAHEHPGSILWVGNIGRRAGGDIPYSVSHNAGRDADLAFYTLDPAGRPVAPPGLLRFGDDGRSRSWDGYYRFDVARNWALVRSLLQSPHAQVQFLFISDGLRNMLLAHARRTGEPGWLVERAALVLRQPGVEIPHDDHLHLRIFCTADDVASGCLNTGRIHPGVARHADARRDAIARSRAALRSDVPSVRVAGIERLVLLNAADALAEIAPLLGDPSAPVRRSAAVAVGDLGGSEHAAWLASRMERETAPMARDALIRGLGALGGADARVALLALLRQPQPATMGDKSWDLRVTALSALAEFHDAGTIDALVALLSDPDEAVVRRAHAVLARLSYGEVVSLEDTLRDGPAARERWSVWWEGARLVGDNVRWNDALRAAGYDPHGDIHARAAELARAAGDPRPWIRISAQRRLMEKTGNTPASLSWPPHDARTYWTRWVRRNPARLRPAGAR